MFPIIRQTLFEPPDPKVFIVMSKKKFPTYPILDDHV